jgi:hypothetical protein
MVPAIDARWPPCRGESGMRISELGVVARVGIEPTTRGFSVQGRAAGSLSKSNTRKGFPVHRPNRPAGPNRFRAYRTELRTEPVLEAMRVKGLAPSLPSPDRARGNSAEDAHYSSNDCCDSSFWEALARINANAASNVLSPIPCWVASWFS